ncbi:F1N21.2 [Arabidopsis thaliana]|uniref:F1N21.2 n=1 Tax=Arabidopsis thaliana TaxID=3702 RepID=Q9FYH3_ARATH|nr:F1N21.2 [Arabidopsis thaliana]
MCKLTYVNFEKLWSVCVICVYKICFRLRHNFVSHLVEALRRNAINVFIDNDQELRGEDISILLKRIEYS